MPWRDAPTVASLPAALWVAAAFAVGPWWLGLIAFVVASPPLLSLARIRLLSTNISTRKLTVGEWTLAIAITSALFLVPGTALSLLFLRWHRSLFSSRM